MRSTFLWLTLTAWACTGTDAVDNDKPTNDDNQGGDDDDDDTADTSGGGPTYWEPVAVGFEYDGAVLSNGDTASFLYDDETGQTYERYPIMVLTFASEAFFNDASLTDEERTAQTCQAISLFYATATQPAQIPTYDDAVLHWSYDLALDLLTESDEHDCNGKIDPAIWGENSENLLGPFDGAHFGYGWGQQTDYLLGVFGEETLADDALVNSMLASYIAINDLSGLWEGQDWTTAFAFEFDETTGYLPTEPDPTDDTVDLLLRVDVSAVPTGTPLPPVYLRSSAYWYQDFPLLDLSNLHDGAP